MSVPRFRQAAADSPAFQHAKARYREIYKHDFTGTPNDQKSYVSLAKALLFSPKKKQRNTKTIITALTSEGVRTFTQSPGIWFQHARALYNSEKFADTYNACQTHIKLGPSDGGRLLLLRAAMQIALSKEKENYFRNSETLALTLLSKNTGKRGAILEVLADFYEKCAEITDLDPEAVKTIKLRRLACLSIAFEEAPQDAAGAQTRNKIKNRLIGKKEEALDYKTAMQVVRNIVGHYTLAEANIAREELGFRSGQTFVISSLHV